MLCQLTFRNIVVGLLANTQLDPALCLLFIFGILTDRIHFNNKEPGSWTYSIMWVFHSWALTD